MIEGKKRERGANQREMDRERYRERDKIIQGERGAEEHEERQRDQNK